MSFLENTCILHKIRLEFSILTPDLLAALGTEQSLNLTQSSR